MNFKKIIRCILTTILLFVFISPINAAQNRISLIKCDGPYNQITTLATNKSSVYSSLPEFATLGSTLIVTRSYSTTIKNNVNFTVFPELIDMGYSRSINAGYSIGWSKKNTSSTTKQLVILRIYDVIRARHYYEHSDGYCALGQDSTYNIAKGWAFDLR